MKDVQKLWKYIRNEFERTVELWNEYGALLIEWASLKHMSVIIENIIDLNKLEKTVENICRYWAAYI